MIPISVSDILKILDQIPIWKALVGLPKRLNELEARIATLEEQASIKAVAPSRPVPEARICPLCDATMRVVKEKPHLYFGDMGMKIHEMECPSCGNKVERDYDGKGYT